MKINVFLAMVACVIGSQAIAGDIYTGNCDSTNADVRSRRSCYTCCNDQNGNSVDTANCQESCDGAWTRVAVDYLPRRLLNALMDTRGDWRAQMTFLDDEQLWDWFTDEDEVNIRVIEMVDWLYQNAADETVARMAVVTLSWLRAETVLSADGIELSNIVMLDALNHENQRIRRGALISLQESRAFDGHPSIMIDMIRATVKDPDQNVRDTGVRLLADY